MSIPLDPPRLQCDDCDEFCNPIDLFNGLCPSCIEIYRKYCEHDRRSAFEGGICLDCGFEFKEPYYGPEYEPDNIEERG